MVVKSFPMPVQFVALMLALPISLCSAEQDALEEEATWSIPTDETVIAMIQEGLTEHGLQSDDVTKACDELQKLLAAEPEDRLDSVMKSLVEAVPSLGEKVDKLLAAPQGSSEDPFLGFSSQLRDQARLWVARSLVRGRLYDEALPLLAPLEPMDVVAPGSLLFYRGVCFHTLLEKDKAVADLTKLLENDSLLPKRFSRTATMMLRDIEPMKEDTLDEIARLMSDVSRRLDLGRASTTEVGREQQIIDKLDKLIDDMEEQQKKQQQQMQQSQSNNPGSQAKPMEDSQIAGGSGPGDIDRKDLGDRSGWGNLPPAERQEALQQISQDLPTHYREAIEAYFRKLATEKP